MITTVAALGAGGASLGGALAQLRHHRDREVLWLITWGLGGLVFLLGLRFTAARYWIPFCAPWILLALRDAGPRLSRIAAIMTVTLSLVLAISDLRFARAQSQLAKRLLAMTEGERGFFAGHWGWQHHFEANGWKPLEEDTAVPFGALLATSEVAWPQEPQDGCFTQVATLSAPASWLPIPRVHTSQGAANFHAFVISQAPPVETYAPWGFGFDPLERVHLQRSCGPKSNLD